MNGWSLIACTTTSPFSSRCGGFTWTMPSSERELLLDLGDRGGRRVLDQHADGAVPEGRELGPQHVVHLPGAGALGQHLGIDRGELHRVEGDAEHDQQRGGGRGDPDRAAPDELREPVPEALLGDPCLALGAALQECGRQPVDARPEQRQHRRQHGQARSRRPAGRRASRRAPSSRGTAAGRRAARPAPPRRSARRRRRYGRPSPWSASSPRTPGPLCAISSR